MFWSQYAGEIQEGFRALVEDDTDHELIDFHIWPHVMTGNKEIVYVTVTVNGFPDIESARLFWNELDSVLDTVLSEIHSNVTGLDKIPQ